MLKVDSGRDALVHEKEAVEPQRGSFAATIENFVNAFKLVAARSPMEKGEILENIDQKIREGIKIILYLSKRCFSLVQRTPDHCITS